MTAQAADFVDQDAQANALCGIRPYSWRKTLAFFAALAVAGWGVIGLLVWGAIEVLT